jgi:hypothetical protein
LIGLVVAATRIPFTTSTLWSWDSVLYARALELGYRQGVDIAEQRPQAPGYVFYVAISWLVRQLTHDSNSALVAVSVVASGLAAAAAYLVARRFARPGAAFAGAIGLGLSPVAWTFGETAVPYELLALGSVSIAGAFHGSRGRPGRTIAASLLWGVAAGFRQDLLIILGPLWLWSIGPMPWRERAVAAAAVAAGCVLWLAPSAIGSGGLDGYIAAVVAQTGRVETMSPVAAGAPQLVRNLALSVFGLFWGSLAIGLVMLVRGLARLPAVGRSDNATFFALWIVPMLVFYTFVHTGDPAYVLSILPAIFIAFAAWLDAMAARYPWAIALGAAVAIAQGVFFVVGPYGLSADVLAEHDRSIRELVAVTSATPARSSIVAAQSGYLTAAYYVRDRPVRFSGAAPEVLDRSARAEPPPSARTTVIVFGGGVELDGVPAASLSATGSIQLFAVDAGIRYPIALYDLEVNEPGPIP